MTLASELTDKLVNLPALPSPPRAALQIIKLARDPDATLPQLAGVVNCDPALAARVLRVSNSIRYGLGRRCENLRQALVVLGMKATLTVALGFSLVDALRKSESSSMNYTHFWQRSLLAAVSARALGDHLKRRDGENLFLAALLQDIGMLAAALLEPSLYGRHEKEHTAHSDLAASEYQALGATHADIGAWLLQQWNMPDYVTEAVEKSHHLDPAAPAGESDIISRCVALSGLMADAWLLNDRVAALNNLTVHALSLLGIDAADLGVVMAKVRDRVPETEAIFEFPLLSDKRMQEVLDEALEMVLAGDLCALREASALIGEAVGGADTVAAGAGLSAQQLLERAGGALQRKAAAVPK